MSCFACAQSPWILLVTFHTFNILNSKNGSLTNRRQRQSDGRIKACHRPTPAALLGLSLIIHRVFVCLPQTDKKHSFLLLHLFSPPVCCVCPLSFIRSPLIFHSMLHFSPLFTLCLSLCCISLPRSRSVFIPLFLCTH